MCRVGVLVSLLLLLTIVEGVASPSDSTAAVWKPSPTGAALRSLAFPGWGQSYNARPLKAVLIGGVEEGLIFGVYRSHQLFRDARRMQDEDAAGFYKEQRNRLTWLLAGAALFSVVDAYVDAHLYGFDVSEQLSAGGFQVGGVKVKFGWSAR